MNAKTTLFSTRVTKFQCLCKSDLGIIFLCIDFIKWKIQNIWFYREEHIRRPFLCFNVQTKQARQGKEISKQKYFKEISRYLSQKNKSFPTMKKNQATFRSGNRTSYSIEEKRQICQYAFWNSQIKAAFKFGVHKSMVSRWMKDVEKFQLADPSAKRISGKITKLLFKGNNKKKTYPNNDAIFSYSVPNTQEHEISHQIVNKETVTVNSQNDCASLITSLNSYDIDLFSTPVKNRVVPSLQNMSAENDLLLCSSGSTHFEPPTKDSSLDEMNIPLKTKLMMKRSGKKKRINHEEYHLDQGLSVNHYPLFPAESSSRDKHDLSILLQVPEIANGSFSNLVNAAISLSANEQVQITKCFEGLSILAKASTNRFRYVPISASK